jgi:hypothetical protein
MVATARSTKTYSATAKLKALQLEVFVFKVLKRLAFEEYRTAGQQVICKAKATSREQRKVQRFINKPVPTTKKRTRGEKMVALVTSTPASIPQLSLEETTAAASQSDSHAGRKYGTRSATEAPACPAQVVPRSLVWFPV